MRRYGRWWRDDLPPLTGPLRLWSYFALMVLAIRNLKSPLRGLGFYEVTDPRVYELSGLLGWLGIGYIDPGVLLGVTVLTAIAWVAAGVGLWSRGSALIAALGACFLHGMYFSTGSYNHYWFLPIYAMFALSLARCRDRWTVDTYLWKPSRPAPLGESGLPRKLILAAAVGFYFSAGVSKLWATGLPWADGQTVQYFGLTRGDRYPLAPVLAGSALLSRFLSIGSLTLEVAAPLALLSRWTRHLFVLGWIGMHVGIRYGMGPAYWPNVVVLTMLIDWRVIFARVRACLGRTWAPSDRKPAPGGERTAAVLGTLVLAATALPGVLRYTWWPFTNVYMYCGYFSIDRNIRAGHPRDMYAEPAGAAQIAREATAAGANREATEYLQYRVGLWLVDDDSGQRLLLRDGLGVNDWKQFVLTVGGPVLLRHLATMSPGDPSPPTGAAGEFLGRYVHVLADHLPPDHARGYDRVEMFYVVSDSDTVGPGDEHPPLDPAFWELFEIETTPHPRARAMTIAAAGLPAAAGPR